jgi:lipopolysaccharide transport system permease protein
MGRRVVLQAGRADREYFRDLWRYRELFYVLAWRDVAVRYKQTVMGVAWAVVRPALATVVFTVVFGKLGRFPSGGVPYPILVLSGMLPWQLFSASLTESGTSLITNSALITKVYFPRLIIPGSSLVTALIDFAISLVMLAILMAYYGFTPGWQLICLPFFIVLTLFTAAGMGAWISALNVKYRDLMYVIPFIVQLGLYISPVGFSSTVVPERWRVLYSFNPMASIIDGFRWCVLGGRIAPTASGLAVSLVVIAILGTTGFLHFRQTERSFADVI